MILNIFGILFGTTLALSGAFGWGLGVIVNPAPKGVIRGSEIVIGVIFVVLAVLKLANVL